MTNKVASDFYIALKLENVEGQPVKAKDVADLKVKVFTSDINRYVEFSDITISDKEDRLYIDYDQLSDLKSGVICYTYSYKVADPNFKDKYFNSTNINYTNFYLRQTTQVGKDADLSQNEILAICDRKLVEQYKELKTLIETSTPKIEVDKELNENSDNPVANSVITQQLYMLNNSSDTQIQDIYQQLEELKNTTPKITVDNELNINSDNPVANRVIDRKFTDFGIKLIGLENVLDLFQKDNLKEYLKGKTEFDLSDFYLPLTKLYIPSTIKIVSNTSKMPDFNYSVETVYIEDGVEELINSFKYFMRLKYITIPASIKKIKGNIFYGCENLEKINFNGRRDQWEKLIEGIKFTNVNPYASVYVSDGYNGLSLPI